MKKRTVNDYFKQHWGRVFVFAAFTMGVSFFAPLKNFQLKWLIDSRSMPEALGYMGLVFLITFTSWFFERLSRRSFTKLACGAVEQVRQRIMERLLHRTVAQYNAEGDAAYLSLLTTDLRTLYDDYYMSLFSIVFWGGIMLCALGMYLYISPVMLAAILLVTIPPLVLPRRMNERLKASRDAFSLQMADYTQKVKSIRCRNVQFTYPGASEPVLRDASLSMDSPQKVALVGESGCGKSTLAKLLFQYYPDYSGDILFNGRQVRDIDHAAFYQHIGYIAQTTYLFNDTLRRNICLLEDFSDEQLEHAIEAAGLTSLVASLPDGLDTIIQENGKNLSGGQRQRIGIARLALRQYDLIIADEITASLDPATSQQVMEHLLALPCMVVAITHDVSGAFMDQFDQIYRVEQGRSTALQRG